MTVVRMILAILKPRINSCQVQKETRRRHYCDVLASMQYIFPSLYILNVATVHFLGSVNLVPPTCASQKPYSLFLLISLLIPNATEDNISAEGISPLPRGFWRCYHSAIAAIDPRSRALPILTLVKPALTPC